MQFDTAAFVVFLALVICVHWSLRSSRLQNGWLLLASYVFYGAWSWKLLALMIVTTLVDYGCGLVIGNSSDVGRRKLGVTVSIVVNLTLLGAAKYYGFFVDEAASLLQSAGMQPHGALLAVIVPAGVSFYTLQSMSYVLDVYRGKQSANRSLLEYAVFVAFFPQLVAGPIERARRMFPQFQAARQWNREYFEGGAQLAVWGYFKKVVIADNLAAYVNAVFTDPSAFSGGVLCVAAIFFAVQLYCELSGYVDIARGTARMLGIELSTQFAHPYFAKNPLEFWSRWQITVMEWFEEYVRCPLTRRFGGNGNWSARVAFLVAMTLLGLWQGAKFTFVAFGLYWGVVIVAYSILFGVTNMAKDVTGPVVRHGDVEQRRAVSPRYWVGVCAMFLLVCLGGILFRAESLDQARYVVTHLASQAGVREVVHPDVLREKYLWMLVVGFWVLELLQRNAATLVAASMSTEWRRLLWRHLMLIAVLGTYFVIQDPKVRSLIDFQF